MFFPVGAVCGVDVQFHGKCKEVVWLYLETLQLRVSAFPRVTVHLCAGQCSFC